MESNLKSSLEGLRIVSFESRRAREMAELIRNYGGEPIIAPSLREIPLSENRAAVDFIGQLEAGAFDYLILLTGVGTRTLVEAVAGISFGNDIEVWDKWTGTEFGNSNKSACW